MVLCSLYACRLYMCGAIQAVPCSPRLWPSRTDQSTGKPCSSEAILPSRRMRALLEVLPLQIPALRPSSGGNGPSSGPGSGPPERSSSSAAQQQLQQPETSDDSSGAGGMGVAQAGVGGGAARRGHTLREAVAGFGCPTR